LESPGRTRLQFYKWIKNGNSALPVYETPAERLRRETLDIKRNVEGRPVANASLEGGQPERTSDKSRPSGGRKAKVHVTRPADWGENAQTVLGRVREAFGRRGAGF